MNSILAGLRPRAICAATGDAAAPAATALKSTIRQPPHQPFASLVTFASLLFLMVKLQARARRARIELPSPGRLHRRARQPGRRFAEPRTSLQRDRPAP